MESPEAIDKFKDSLYKLLAEATSDGLQVATMRVILNDAIDNLELSADCKKWLETFTQTEENVTGSLK